jgi:signal transduction histidine kinase
MTEGTAPRSEPTPLVHIAALAEQTALIDRLTAPLDQHPIAGTRDDRVDLAEIAHGVREAARRALAEARALLELLGPTDDRVARRPPPATAELTALADVYRSEGLRVDLLVVGQLSVDDEALDLTVFRLVDLALQDAAAASHAAHAEIVVRRRPDAIIVVVTDDGDRSGRAEAERGVAEMRERVRVFDGSLDVETLADGRHRVTARLPAEEAAG